MSTFQYIVSAAVLIMFVGSLGFLGWSLIRRPKVASAITQRISDAASQLIVPEPTPSATPSEKLYEAFVLLEADWKRQGLTSMADDITATQAAQYREFIRSILAPKAEGHPVPKAPDAPSPG